MSIRTKATKLLAVLAAVLMLLLSAGFAWAVVGDFATRGLVPSGVTFAGRDLGGMTEDAARAVIEDTIASDWMRPLAVSCGDEKLTLDPKSSLQVDVDAMLTSAYQPFVDSTLVDRSYRKLADRPLAHEIEPVLDVNGGSLEEWVASAASRVDTPSADATITVVDGAVVMQHSAAGAALDRDASVKAITDALLGRSKSVELPVKTIQPAVKDADLGKTIVVDVSQRRLYLYNGLTLEKSYGVAVGTASYPTPKGSFRIVQKRYMPSWSNPGSDWAEDMPASIPPGPSNPLGTRALNLNAPGIRIHGTTKNSSIGTAASHGCMRMHRWDIEDLYPRVNVGTPVLIVR